MLCLVMNCDWRNSPRKQRKVKLICFADALLFYQNTLENKAELHRHSWSRQSEQREKKKRKKKLPLIFQRVSKNGPCLSRGNLLMTHGYDKNRVKSLPLTREARTHPGQAGRQRPRTAAPPWQTWVIKPAASDGSPDSREDPWLLLIGPRVTALLRSPPLTDSRSIKINNSSEALEPHFHVSCRFSFCTLCEENPFLFSVTEMQWGRLKSKRWWGSIVQKYAQWWWWRADFGFCGNYVSLQLENISICKYNVRLSQRRSGTWKVPIHKVWASRPTVINSECFTGSAE